MEKNRIYEKIGIFRNEGFSDTEMAKKISNSDLTLTEAMETIHRYERIQILRKKLQDCVKGVEYDYKHNEYGIPMIATDEDW